MEAWLSRSGAEPHYALVIRDSSRLPREIPFLPPNSPCTMAGLTPLRNWLICIKASYMQVYCSRRLGRWGRFLKNLPIPFLLLLCIILGPCNIKSPSSLGKKICSQNGPFLRPILCLLLQWGSANAGLFTNEKQYVIGCSAWNIGVRSGVGSTKCRVRIWRWTFDLHRGNSSVFAWYLDTIGYFLPVLVP